MIVKELDGFYHGDTLAKAGRKAEENLAFYLTRAFKSSPDFLVFHNIRLEDAGDAAQMDHLILHRYGLIIVESKSVASKVRINESGEWTRLWNGSWRGMPSPIKQAERQGEFLREILQASREKLRNKVLFGLKQGGFLNMNIDLLVSISDNGVIERGKNILPEVCKADQITDRIQEVYIRHKKLSSYMLSQDEIERIALFLRYNHRPLPSTEVRDAPVALTDTQLTNEAIQQPKDVDDAPTSTLLTDSLRCRHCQTENVNVVYGRYGYYLKCGSCEGNTPLNRLCKTCGGKEKTRKESQRFFAECAACSTSYVFHENIND